MLIVEGEQDLAYAESLRRIRQVVEKPAASGLPAAATGAPSAEQFGVLSSCAKALNTLGEVQQQQSEKLSQFAGVIRRDVVLRPLEEMVATYDERSAAMLAEGNRLDAMLHAAQQSVLDAFGAFDAVFRSTERERARVDAKQDLWLAEIVYSIHVHKLRQSRVAYVTGMASLFQQYKTLEVMRVAVVQTALDTYIRKQKLLYDELAGGMAEPMAAVNVRVWSVCGAAGDRTVRLTEDTMCTYMQRIDPDRDLLHSVRRIPKNVRPPAAISIVYVRVSMRGGAALDWMCAYRYEQHTAAALTAEDAEQTLFGSLRSPIASPLLVRCGFLKLQVVGSLFRSWKDVLCAVTQDEFLHLIELKDGATRAITQSSDAMLDAISCHEQTREVQCASVCLTHCRVEILKADAPTFEVTELTAATGLFGAMFRLENTRKFTFQCANQSDLIDWVIAAKRFLSTGATSSSAAAAAAHHGANRPSV